MFQGRLANILNYNLMDDDQRNTLATLLKSFICSHAKYKNIIALN